MSASQLIDLTGNFNYPEIILFVFINNLVYKFILMLLIN